MKKPNAAVPYALMQFCLWGIYGFLFSFAHRFFIEALGLNGAVAGLVIGLATALAFALQPLLTAVTDRGRLSVRAVLLLCAGLLAVLCAALLLPLPNAVRMVLYGLACTALQVLPSFTNALGMAAIHAGLHIPFGIARGIGSMAFALTARLAVLGIHHIGLNAIPLCSGVLAAGLTLAAVCFPRNGISADTAANATPLRIFLRRQKRFCVLLVGVTLLYVGHNLLSNYMYQIAVFKGDADTQGTALMIAALLELPTMFLFGRLLKLARCDCWLLLSGVFMTLRVVLVLVLPNVTGLYIAQGAQLLGFALFAVCSVYYVSAVIPPEDVVKGQTYLGAANTLGSLLASFSGGAIVELGGVTLLLTLCAVLSAVGAAILFFAAERAESVS